VLMIDVRMGDSLFLSAVDFFKKKSISVNIFSFLLHLFYKIVDCLILLLLIA